MWKKISVVAGGMALAVALPFVALAVTTDEVPDANMPADAAVETVQTTTPAQVAAEIVPVEPTGPWVSPNAVEPVAIQSATMARQQLRVHAETGPPAGFESVQQRLHADDPLGMGPGSENAKAPGAAMNHEQNMQNHQNQEMVKGNPNAPMSGAGTGECPSDGTDCPNPEDPGQAMTNQNQNEEMVQGNPDAPMNGAGTGDPEDCPHDEQRQGAGAAGRGGRNG
jgi:hypothetical protein